MDGKASRKGLGRSPGRIIRFPVEPTPASKAVDAATRPLEETRVPKDLRKLPTAAPKRRIEIVSSGVDEFAQVFGTDPYGGTSWPGLRVPTTATALLANVSPTTPASKLRYLFLLAAFTIPEGARARIVSLRTSWTLGALQGAPANPRFVEQIVTNPFFRLQDGNVSFHLRQSAPTANQWSGNAQGTIVNLTPPPATLPNMPNLVFRNSRMPAMLFETISYAGPTSFYPTGVTAYTPPNGGLPWGDTLATGYGTFQDLRMQYAAGNDWNDVDLPVEGPACVQLFASVRQTNPGQGGRTALAAPSTPLNFPAGLSPEEQFLLNFPTAVIWRVAGSLGVEMEDRK